MSLHTVAAAQARYWAEAGPGKAYGGAYSVGYSQPHRRTVYANSDEAGWLTANADADCSSLVCGAINFGLHGAHGVPWGHPALLEINDFWTGNMRGGLEARGFYEVSWNDSDLYPAGGLRIGDVLLSAKNEGGRGHVVMVTSDGYVSESWVNSQNGDGWDEPDEPVGDQTGGETRTIAYTAHPDTLNGRWTSCHRFDEARFLSQWPEFARGSAPASTPAPAAPASSSAPAATTTTSTTTGDDEMIFIYTERGDDKTKEYTILRGGFPPLRVAGIIETSYRQVCGNPIFQWPDFYDRTVADWQAAYDRLVADTAAATAAAIKEAAA